MVAIFLINQFHQKIEQSQDYLMKIYHKNVEKTVTTRLYRMTRISVMNYATILVTKIIQCKTSLKSADKTVYQKNDKI